MPAVVLALALAASPTPAPTASPAIDAARLPVAFRDVAFGSTPAEVEAKLAPLEALERKPDAIAFAGTLDARAVQVHALFTPKTRRLWKIGVVYLQPVNRPFDELEGAWTRERARLAETLGEPTRSFAFFKTPVTQGGELAALKAGDGQFSAVWQLADGYVACEISRFGNVVVSWEHTALAAKDDEERAAPPRPAPLPKPKTPAAPAAKPSP